jgi:HPt (histidine-containing phosphotransfer) domain-containing protein
MEQNSEVFDSSSALASVGGDVEFLQEIAGLVRAAWPALLSDIREDLAAGDFSDLEANARLARAAAGYVAAGRAGTAATQLQTTVVRRDWAGAKRAIEDLEGEVAKLQSALSILRTPRGCRDARRPTLACRPQQG